MTSSTMGLSDAVIARMGHWTSIHICPTNVARLTICNSLLWCIHFFQALPVQMASRGSPIPSGQMSSMPLPPVQCHVQVRVYPRCPHDLPHNLDVN